MKKIIAITFVALMVGISSVYAQRNINKEDRAKKHLEKMDELLNLTGDQTSQMETLFISFGEDMKFIRENEDLDRDQKQEALKQQRENHKVEIEKILSKEQIEIWEEHQAERQGDLKHGDREKGNRPEMDDKGKALIMEKRAEFDSELSNEEKETIASIRTQMETRRKACEAGEKPNDKDERKAKREEHKNVIKPLIEIVENHDAELQQIGEELRAEMDLKTEKIKKTHKYDFANSGEHRRGMDPERPDRHAIHFLLMDPNKQAAENTTGQVDESLEIYPNPVLSSFTIAFDMQEEGLVTIELLNKYGGMLEVLDSENCAEGTNSFTYDASYLAPTEIYFVRVIKPESVKVEKLIKL